MRTYSDPRSDLTRVRLVRDATDSLRLVPELRNVGLAARREIAVRVVDAGLTNREGQP